MKCFALSLLSLGFASSTLFGSTVCKDTLESAHLHGTCYFGSATQTYAFDFTSFSTASSTIANPLTPSDIDFEASLTASGVDVTFSVANGGPFIANDATAGIFALADYVIKYDLAAAPGSTEIIPFAQETLTVGGGSVSQGFYGVTKLAMTPPSVTGTSVVVLSGSSQSESANLPSSPFSDVDVTDDLLLSAAGTGGSAQFSTVTNSFTFVPEPISLTLCGGGLLLMALLKFRRRLI
jgi:hypothetical protein